MPNKFRFTIGLVLISVFGLFGWWWLQSRSAVEAPGQLAAALEQEGWRATFGEVTATGAPNWLDLIITRPELAAPSGDWAWGAAELLAGRMVYDPTFFRFRVSGPQRVETPAGPLRFEARAADATLRFGADGYPREEVSRFSAVWEDVESPDFAAGRVEAHIGPPPQRFQSLRRLYVGAMDLAIGRAPQVNFRLDGEALFDRPLRRDARGAPTPVALTLKPGLVLTWGAGRPSAGGGSGDAGTVGVLRVGGQLVRDGGSDLRTGWRGSLAFESDQARGALEVLEGMGLISAASRDRLLARVASGGRLAGVLEVRDGVVTVRDVGPEPIRISAR
ncbi:MAG: DUF2125 domain-containing protein [Pseudomonadota bacterium]